MAKLPADVTSLAIIGNYLPRRCGIATFTTDLAEALDKEMGHQGEVFALAIDDIPEGYTYPERVSFQIQQNKQADYRLAADFITASRANVVILQHEYGIFGGPAGAQILRTLRELRVPILTTLHTVLTKPTPEQRSVMDELKKISDRLVVMSSKANSILRDVYDVSPDRIANIPHGIHDMPFVDPNYYKGQFKAEGRQVILTFGLLSPNKGIEYMIEAIPKIVKKYPDVLYIILGATHPHLVKQFGEAYRSSLQQRATDLGIRENVRFVNQFVQTRELCEYIGTADLYVTPYLNEAQITSGTLAYATGAGKAVVSTPYWHAQELLKDGRGRLVPFKDPDALAESVNYLLTNETKRHQMRKRAYDYCRNMIWSNVARRYIELAREVLEERAHKPRPQLPERRRVARAEELPELDLRHLRNLTDSTGLLQHAIHVIPDRRHGYCADDNGRALVFAALYNQLYRSSEVDDLATVYLAYLNHAFNPKNGRFANFMSYDRRWLDAVGSEDSHGRALWGLGMMAAHASNENLRSLSVRLFQGAVPVTENFRFPRAWAYSLLGIHAYLEHFGGDATVRRLRHVLADRLFALFKKNAGPNWPWCESTMSYSNATLAQALVLSGTWIPNGEMRDQGLRSLRWLCDIQRGSHKQFSFIGNQGWYPRGQEKARFDQQPIEAAQMVLACAEAYRTTSDEYWLAESRRALEWFLGRNDLNVPIYDFSSGGCRDGLTPDGANVNQGAESTLAWLIALPSFLIQASQQTLLVKQDEVSVEKTDKPRANSAASELDAPTARK